MKLSPSKIATGVAVATLFLLENVASFQKIHLPVRTQNRGWLPEQRVKVMHRSPVSSQLSFSFSSSPSRATLTSPYAATVQNETDPSPKKANSLQFLSRLSLLRTYAKRVLRKCRQTVASLAFAVLLVFFCHSNAAWAVSGGRMGGSFGATSRSSSYGTTSRGVRVPMGQYHPNAGPRMHMHAHLGPSSRMYGSRENFPGDTSVATQMSPSSIALLTTTTIVLAYGFGTKRRRDGETSPLGPGATVASLTISLGAQNRNDPDCLLNRLKSISDKFDTSHRKGVQDLVAAVALELLRHDDNIVSAQANSEQFTTVSQAERQFQRMSVQGRSKLDRETGMYKACAR
jgi:hypothetical protein